MGERSPQLQGGQLLVAISNAMVTIIRDFAGKGPQGCKSYWAGRDVLVVLMRGGYTAAEQTLYESGHGQAVRQSRQAFVDSVETRMSEVVQDLTGRRVVAFMSTSHQNPDLTAELFVLEPEDGSAAGAEEILPE